jgi:hypothetical protein
MAPGELDELAHARLEYAVDPANRFQTVLGTVGFDANGDSLQQIVTLHRVGAPAAGTALDWLVEKQQDFGPARSDLVGSYSIRAATSSAAIPSALRPSSAQRSICRMDSLNHAA